MKPLVLIFILLLMTRPVQAAQWGLFYGLGTNFKPGESIRLSVDDIEFGLLADQAMGVVKNFKSDWKYGSLGLATTGNNLGLFGAMGFEWNMFWQVHFRGELYVLSYFDGFARGRALLGLSFYF